jgi:hypothetical protein
MTRKKGRMIYVPPNLIDVAEEIKITRGYKKRSRAFSDLAQHARVGMEAEKIYKLNFTSIFGKKIRRRK